MDALLEMELQEVDEIMEESQQEDEAKLIEWLKENNKDLLRVKYEPDKNEIKKVYKVVGTNVVTEDGELVEGITIEERPEKITIKVVE